MCFYFYFLFFGVGAELLLSLTWGVSFSAVDVVFDTFSISDERIEFPLINFVVATIISPHPPCWLNHLIAANSVNVIPPIKNTKVTLLRVALVNTRVMRN
jgi:hypothetical protein